MKSEPRSRFTVHVPLELGERLANAAAATSTSIAAVLQAAVAAKVVELEAANVGQPYPPRVRIAAAPVADVDLSSLFEERI